MFTKKELQEVGPFVKPAFEFHRIYPSQIEYMRHMSSSWQVQQFT